MACASSCTVSPSHNNARSAVDCLICFINSFASSAFSAELADWAASMSMTFRSSGSARTVATVGLCSNFATELTGVGVLTRAGDVGVGILAGLRMCRAECGVAGGEEKCKGKRARRSLAESLSFKKKGSSLHSII